MYGFIWLLFLPLCYWLAKAKGTNVKKWTILGFLFGPIAFAILLLKKKTDASSAPLMIREQATESLRNFQYLVENISDRIGGSKFKKR